MSIANTNVVYDAMKDVISQSDEITKSTFIGRLQGDSFQDIADKIGSDYGTVYSTDQAIRKKVSEKYREKILEMSKSRR